MKTIKVSNLSGAALDWAVANCEGRKPMYYNGIVRATASPRYPDSAPMFGPELNYSTDWSQGGPIIERYGISVCEGSPVNGLEWMACDRGSTYIQHGSTYLIAAMRCYVAGKLGDEVEIPDELAF
jgi:hypothetical protein